MSRLLLAALLVAAPLSVTAEIVTRCVAPDGRLTFSNRGCPAGARAETLDLDAAPVDSSGLRAWARRSPPARTPAERRQARSEPRAARIHDVVACENARRDLRFEAGYNNGRRGRMGAVREEVRQACGGR